jgi:protein-tyrosine phosphatase
MPPSSQITRAALNLRYGVLFALVAAMLIVAATRGGWFWLCLWPSVAFSGLALAYLTGNPRVFGKRSDGNLAAFNVVVLLPVTALLTLVFHLARLVSREPAYHAIADNILIGRRLLSREWPGSINAVIDLTSEFAEPARPSGLFYLSIPILDASTPAESQLHEALRQAGELQGTIYIHCAQGHGRTALFASCLLLQRGVVATVDEALALIQSRRPHARLNQVQDRFLREVAPRITRELKPTG